MLCPTTISSNTKRIQKRFTSIWFLSVICYLFYTNCHFTAVWKAKDQIRGAPRLFLGRISIVELKNENCIFFKKNTADFLEVILSNASPSPCGGSSQDASLPTMREIYCLQCVAGRPWTCQYTQRYQPLRSISASLKQDKFLPLSCGAARVTHYCATITSAMFLL